MLLKQYKIRIIELLLCVAIPLVIYYPALGFPAFSEDFFILNGIRTSDLSKTNSLRYIGDFTLYFEQLIFNSSYFIHHLFSLIFHGLTGFMSLVVAMRIFDRYLKLDPPQAAKAAYLIAILFLLFPFHLESVFWIAGRGVILASLFGLLSIYFFLEADFSEKSNLFFSVIFYVLALFCYESIIFLPVIFLLAENKIPSLKAVRIISPYFLVLLVYLLLGFLLDKFNLSTGYYRFDLDIFRVLKNLVALHIRLFTAPIEHSWYFALFGLFLLSGQLLFLRHLIHGNREIFNFLRSITIFFFALLPFAWLGIDTHDFEGGRYLYFASSIYLILLIGLLFKTLSRTYLTLVSAAIFIYFFSVNRVVLNTWTFSATLIQRSLETIPKYSGPLLVVNVPDSYRGVYIFRKGLDQAIVDSGNRLANDPATIHIQTVDWAQFIAFENRFRTFSGPERSTYVAELRTLYRRKFPKTPDSSISVYLFTSTGLIELSNTKEKMED